MKMAAREAKTVSAFIFEKTGANKMIVELGEIKNDK
jgi:hypothetical protein